MRQVKKDGDKWILLDPQSLEQATINVVQYEPDPEEVYKSFVLFEGGYGNSACISLVYGPSIDEALQMAVEEYNIDPEQVYGIEQVNIIFN